MHSMQILAALANTEAGWFNAIPTMMRMTPAAIKDIVMTSLRMMLSEQAADDGNPVFVRGGADLGGLAVR